MNIAVSIGDGGIGNVILATPLITALSKMHKVWTCGDPTYDEVIGLISNRKLLVGHFRKRERCDIKFDIGIETYSGRIGSIPNFKDAFVMPSFAEKIENVRRMGEAKYNLTQARKMGILEEPRAYAMTSGRPFPTYRYCIHAGCDPNRTMSRWEGFPMLARELDSPIAVVGKGSDGAMQWPGNCTSYVDRLSLLDTAALIKGCGMMISNDSGMMHLASALGVPVVAVFGPTDPVKSRPWNEPFRIVRAGVECSPCWFVLPDEGRFRQCKDRKCLSSITIADVMKSIEKFHSELSGV